MANAEITVGVKHWAWQNWTSSNFDRNITVITNADGKFEGVVLTAPGYRMSHPTVYEIFNGTSTHILEQGAVYAHSTENANVKVEKEIYILGGTR